MSRERNGPSEEKRGGEEEKEREKGGSNYVECLFRVMTVKYKYVKC